jgi:hypothetical protein
MPGWVLLEIALAILPVCGMGLVYRTLQDRRSISRALRMRV